MAQQIIDTTTDHGTYKGDPAKVAFGKVNDNFSQLMAQQAAARVLASPPSADGLPTYRALDMLHMPSAVRDAIASLKSGAKADILGTVAQSGGVPTGAIMEAGSNANGYYFRFANGLQLCYRLVGLSNIPTGVSIQSGTMTFPAQFYGPPLTFIHVNCEYPFSVTQNSEPGVSFASFVYSIRNGHFADLGVYHGYMAIGRWF